MSVRKSLKRSYQLAEPKTSHKIAGARYGRATVLRAHHSDSLFLGRYSDRLHFGPIPDAGDSLKRLLVQPAGMSASNFFEQSLSPKIPFELRRSK